MSIVVEFVLTHRHVKGVFYSDARLAVCDGYDCFSSVHPDEKPSQKP